ncbi:MAG: carboxypeptidase regulatory-like domain-containing protein [Syntrophobacteraceae bacterium]
MPDPLQSFEGVHNVNGVAPPDTQGDVGPNHYVQWVNLAFAVYDKSGNRLYGPASGNTLWQGFGGACAETNDGDPITAYDQIADRWVMTQFALPSYPDAPFYQCVAVSTTNDPTGSWYRYQWRVPSDKMNDYPKLGVWPDGYYLSINQFTAGSGSWGGAGVAVFERAKMLQGLPARVVYFDVGAINAVYGGMLPTDLDGTDPPPLGSPNYFMEVDHHTWIGPSDALRLWRFHVDWTNTANSTFGGPGFEPDAIMASDPWDPLPCIAEGSRNCVPQPDTSQKLDALGDRLMYRLAYRNFGDRESLVVNHTVNGGGGVAGIRWYEVRDPGGSPVIYQQGTYAPSDGGHRWMGSMAMDGMGNMALGYSVSSASIYPSVRYTGRLVSDPPGVMAQGESEIVAGAGSQTASHARWGDYSMMAVDPADDCTFWYTQEYYPVTDGWEWHTRIGSFKFPSCSEGPVGTIRGLVRDEVTLSPIEGAAVTAVAGSISHSTATGPDGKYRMDVAPGDYDVTAFKYGFSRKLAKGVPVVAGQATARNFLLHGLNLTRACGTVKDGSGHGWPLHAKVSIAAEGFQTDVYTSARTGRFCADLYEGVQYAFTVEAMSGGYLPYAFTGGPGDPLAFKLAVDPSSCSAPGYGTVEVFVEDFDSATPPALPAGWAAAAVTGAGGLWATNPSTVHPGGAPPKSLPNLVYFNAYNVQVGDSARLYRTVGADLSALSEADLKFWMHHDTGYPGSNDRVQAQVSVDGGLSWSNVGSEVPRAAAGVGWARHTVSLDGYVGPAMSDVRVAFLATSAYGNDIHIDGAAIGSRTCIAVPGGILLGTVRDANTGIGLNEATVTGGGATTSTAQTPAGANGFYSLFAGAASGNTVQFTGSKGGGYGADTEIVTIANNAATRRDFHLPAGKTAVAPRSVALSLEKGTTGTAFLDLSNTGGLAANFRVAEFAPAAAAAGPFQKPRIVVKPFKQGFRDAAGLPKATLPAAPPYAAGEIIRSWSAPVDIFNPWGIAFDGTDQTVWVASPAPGWEGVNRFFELTLDGEPTGRSWPFSWSPQGGPADGAFVGATGKLWIVNIGSGSENCIHEIDPAAGYTGRRVCPGGGFVNSQRGLAYDPVTDSFYAGSWNDSMIHHFTSNGAMLDEVDVGLPISGLAYNFSTGHLFAITSTNSESPIFVLDAANDYAPIGAFGISGFRAWGGAGMEIDCDGNLWVVDQVTHTVYQVGSGETMAGCVFDIPWMSAVPATGTIAATNGTGRVAVNLDAGSPAVTRAGTYRARLKIFDDTPYSGAYIPVSLDVSWTHHITAGAGSAGAISPSGKVGVPHGGRKTFTITPSEGHKVAGLRVDGTSVPFTSSATGEVTHTFTNVIEDHRIAATFAFKTYTITPHHGVGGTTSPANAVRVSHGGSKSFTVTANTGYRIADVVVDGETSLGPVTTAPFTDVTSDHSFMATFAKLQYTITAAAGTGGTINPVGAATAAYGTSKRYVIRASAGYRTAQVLVDGAPVTLAPDGSYTFANIQGDHDIQADFIAVHTINSWVTGSTGGTISPGGYMKLDEGAGQTYTATPAAGYYLSILKVDGISVPFTPDAQGVVTYTFDSVTSNHTIVARFAVRGASLRQEAVRE